MHISIIYTHIRIYIRIYIFTYTKFCKQANIMTYIHTYIQPYIDAYIHTYVHTWVTCVMLYLRMNFICMFRCAHRHKKQFTKLMDASLKYMYYCAESIGYDSYRYTDMQATRYIQTETYKFIGAMGLKGLGNLHISSHLPGFVRFDWNIRFFVSLCERDHQSL